MDPLLSKSAQAQLVAAAAAQQNFLIPSDMNSDNNDNGQH
jgi:hypothetical protein